MDMPGRSSVQVQSGPASVSIAGDSLATESGQLDTCSAVAVAAPSSNEELALTRGPVLLGQGIAHHPKGSVNQSSQAALSAAPMPAYYQSMFVRPRSVEEQMDTLFTVMSGRATSHAAIERAKGKVSITPPLVRSKFSSKVFMLLAGQAVLSSAVATIIEVMVPFRPSSIGTIVMLLLLVLVPVLHSVLVRCRHRRPARVYLLIVLAVTKGAFGGFVRYFPVSLRDAPIFSGAALLCITALTLILHALAATFGVPAHMAKSLQPRRPRTSKARIIEGTNEVMLGAFGMPVQAPEPTWMSKFAFMWQDEEAGVTRAALLLTLLFWLVSSLAVVLALGQLLVTSRGVLLLASVVALLPAVFMTYGVEKQMRKCRPNESLEAVINVTNDWCLLIMSNPLSLQESDLGSATGREPPACPEAVAADALESSQADVQESVLAPSDSRCAKDRV